MYEIKEKYNVYIYGMGNEYNRLTSYLSFYKNKMEILGIVTTEKQDIAVLDGYKCITLDEIEENRVDYIIIAVVKWKEIFDILEQHGIDEKKIIRSSVFFNPWFDLDEYLKLKHSDVTILSNYCLGGLIYQELGLKMLSPTINMFCLGRDYLEFLNNYRYYLSLEMQEYEQNNYIEGTMGSESFFPKGILKNKVVWYFNHHVNALEAVEQWNVRAKRVNVDNVAVIMIIQNDEELQRFEELKLDKKLGIYHKNVGGDNIIYCPKWENARERFKFGGNWPWAANSYLCNSRGYVSPISWIKFLNGELEYMRF